MFRKQKRQRLQNQNGTLSHDLHQLWRCLSPRRHHQLRWLLFLLSMTSLSEMVSLGAIFPFLTSLDNADTLLNNPRLQPVLVLFKIENALQLVKLLGIAFIIVVILANGLRLITLYTRTRLAAAIGADISCQIYSTTLRQPYSFHITQNSSDLIQTLTIDMDRFTNNVLIPVLDLLSNAVLVPALIAALLLIDGKIALGAAFILGGTYISIYRARQHLLKLNSKRISQSSQRKIKLVQEGIGGIRDVLLGNFQNYFEPVYLTAETSLKQAAANNRIVSQSPAYIIEALALSSIVLLSLSLAQGDDFSHAIPVLGSLALGAKRLLPALQQLFASLAKIQGAQASLVRILVALQRPANSFMGNISAKRLPVEQEIRLDNVWFRYGSSTDWVLRSLSLKIEAKTTVGFVGSTGSGKSTTADLILGLLQPQKGSILVDGQLLEGERLRHWQRSIAHVPQSIFLSDGTITENIAFGVPQSQIDFGEVRRAACLAQLDDFIIGLPAGYDTYVGERGVRLSGGQRQRIGIARALYQQASVIIFDEATSALDNTTEKEVMAAIEELSHQFTIILIAHRLSTVQRCDLIVELGQGQVVAKGNYQDLIQRSESFRRMVSKA